MAQDRKYHTGDQITGLFVKPLVWPQPTPGSVPTPAAFPEAVPTAVSSPQPTPAAVQSYTEFRTAFPDTVGDPRLMGPIDQDALVRSLGPRLEATAGLPIKPEGLDLDQAWPKSIMPFGGVE
jgi:hypothetical protein